MLGAFDNRMRPVSAGEQQRLLVVRDGNLAAFLQPRLTINLHRPRLVKADLDAMRLRDNEGLGQLAEDLRLSGSVRLRE